MNEQILASTLFFFKNILTKIAKKALTWDSSAGPYVTKKGNWNAEGETGNFY